ncbi:DEAD-box ATP-dependent RNA helicase, partial [Trifolium medium]|nr:DEAD-box ATP-dependent RNA helicase [Trifolium medium]
EGFAFPVEIVYERIPDYCNHCHIIGHSVNACNKLHPKLPQAAEDRGMKATLTKPQMRYVKKVINHAEKKIEATNSGTQNDPNSDTNADKNSDTPMTAKKSATEFGSAAKQHDPIIILEPITDLAAVQAENQKHVDSDISDSEDEITIVVEPVKEQVLAS